jgi:adenylyltransferase/sulfurtransferase
MPRVNIRIPAPLRPFVAGRSKVEVEADTVNEALERLTEANQELRPHLYEDDGCLRRFVNVYLGDRELRELRDGEDRVTEESELSIVPSIAGGGASVRSPTAMTRPAGKPESVSLSSEELQRYSRHLMIPEVGLEGQKKLKSSRVLLIGAGGLGSPLGLYLAAAGIGRLGIVDFDVVDFTNLQRQVLHDTPSVGRPKLESARDRIEALNPEIEVVTYEARLESANALEIFEEWDVVVDGSDNFPTRYLVNDACVLLGKPSVYGAIFRFEGQASVFGANGGPCYRCLFREPPPPGLVPSCADAGVLGILPGIVGTIQAAEAVKLILGVGDTLAGRLLLIDALGMEFRELKVRPDPECPVCGDTPTITELIDYEQFCGTSGDDAALPEVPEVSVTELQRLADAAEPFQLIDVREPYEWEICNLEAIGARLIPLDQVTARAPELSPRGPLIVHCRSGARSAKAVESLRARGYENATNLRGGILAWAHEVDPHMPVY